MLQNIYDAKNITFIHAFYLKNKKNNITNRLRSLLKGFWNFKDLSKKRNKSYRPLLLCRKIKVTRQKAKGTDHLSKHTWYLKRISPPKWYCRAVRSLQFTHICKFSRYGCRQIFADVRLFLRMSRNITECWKSNITFITFVDNQIWYSN